MTTSLSNPLLDDLEFGDIVHFRNGGSAVVTFFSYEKIFESYETVFITFDSETSDWMYELTGEVFDGEKCGFDIVKVSKPTLEIANDK